MQNKLLLLGLGILVTVAAAGFLLTRGQLSGPRSSPQRQNPSVVTPAAPSPTGQEQTVLAKLPEIIVSGDEYKFSPSSITLAAGEKTKITFKNVGSAPHDFTITELGVKTAVISAGEEISVEVTAPRSGEYTFFCSVGNHRQLGMEGRVAVTQ